MGVKWTKVDIARMQYAMDFVRSYNMQFAKPDRYGDALAALREHAHELVLGYLRAMRWTCAGLGCARSKRSCGHW